MWLFYVIFFIFKLPLLITNDTCARTEGKREISLNVREKICLRSPFASFTSSLRAGVLSVLVPFLVCFSVKHKIFLIPLQQDHSAGFENEGISKVNESLNP